jgi:hypothetical protein
LQAPASVLSRLARPSGNVKFGFSQKRAFAAQHPIIEGIPSGTKTMPWYIQPMSRDQGGGG